MIKTVKLFFTGWLLLFVMACPADTFLSPPHYQACFTPGENCTQVLVDTIHQAKQKILVQAYTFTSAPIAQALVQAKQRGIDVKIILDKSQVHAQYSSATYFIHSGIVPRIDASVQIAHNKAMIIDDKVVVTGSFNFTKAAQEKNAENLLIVSDPQLARLYSENWYRRYQASIGIGEYQWKKKNEYG